MIYSLKDAADPETNIIGVELKEFVSYADERGFFRELIRHNDTFFQDSFAQWSHSKMARNTVKAWHFHHLQIDWWYCPIGLIHVVLFDLREESPTHRRKLELCLGESGADPAVLPAIVKIPTGVAHACKVLSDSAHLFYVTSKTYDSQDEGRYPFDSEEIPHSWGPRKELIVSERDRTRYTPKYCRQKLAL